MIYNGKVVRNKEISQAELFLQILKHIHNLRLNGDIKSGYRLITDNKFGIYGKRSGNSYSLSLPSGKLVRITVRMLGVQPYGRKEG